MRIYVHTYLRNDANKHIAKHAKIRIVRQALRLNTRTTLGHLTECRINRFKAPLGRLNC